MLQCVPLADSCLALGQASCRRARELAQQYAGEGVLVGMMCLKEAASVSSGFNGCNCANVPTCRLLVGSGLRPLRITGVQGMCAAKLVFRWC